jgi:hypothetical protein
MCGGSGFSHDQRNLTHDLPKRNRPGIQPGRSDQAKARLRSAFGAVHPAHQHRCQEPEDERETEQRRCQATEDGQLTQ